MTTETLIKMNSKFDFLMEKIDDLEGRVHDLELNSLSSTQMFDYSISDNKTTNNDVDKTSKLDIFDAIMMNLENCDWNTRLRFILPRQVGTTTFLVRLAINLIEQHKKVLYLVDTYNLARDINYRFDINFVSSLKDKLDGYDYDYIICDNCSSELIARIAYLEIQSIAY